VRGDRLLELYEGREEAFQWLFDAWIGAVIEIYFRKID
jgi:hypothetical protein